MVDVVVAGGGLAGVAAAAEIAADGKRVLLLESTGMLGRETTRARCLLYDEFAAGQASAVKESSSAALFRQCLQQRNGLCAGQIDPVHAAVALDDMMAERKVDVLFHIIAIRLLIRDHAVVGLRAAGKSGSFDVYAPQVVDASEHGKLTRPWMRESSSAGAWSMLHLLYGGVESSCPAQAEVFLQSGEMLQISCRPALRQGQWRVGLRLNRRLTRQQWGLLLEEALPKLHEAVSQLAGGVLAHIAEDAFNSPEFALFQHDEAQTDGAVRLGGLASAGRWLTSYPQDTTDEGVMMRELFRLGADAAQLVRQTGAIALPK